MDLSEVLLIDIIYFLTSFFYSAFSSSYWDWPYCFAWLYKLSHISGLAFLFSITTTGLGFCTTFYFESLSTSSIYLAMSCDDATFFTFIVDSWVFSYMTLIDLALLKKHLIFLLNSVLTFGTKLYFLSKWCIFILFETLSWCINCF